MKRSCESLLYGRTMYSIVGAEGDYPAIGRYIMDATPLYPFQVEIIGVLEVHGANEERFAMEFCQ